MWLMQMEESARVVHDDVEVRQMAYRVQVLSRPTTLTAQVIHSQRAYEWLLVMVCGEAPRK